MARFFVGQRVRVVRAFHPQNSGITGRIERIQRFSPGDPLPNGEFLSGEVCDCWVELDRARHDGRTSGASSFWRLEPILPEGHTQSIYSFQELMDKCREGVAA